MNGLAILGAIFAAGIIGYFILIEGGAVTGGKLNAQQIANYASIAGFTGDDLTNAVAIALAESGGDPKAHGDTNLGSGTGSFGLWQIFSDAHPEFGPDFTTLYDPQTNANAAFSVFKQQGFTAWTTYKNSDYMDFLPQASQATQAS